ncbi:MAG TPA: metallophosphoesterase [Anaerolineaceae bacterium]|nr:metallophosphoesterase [Anaerolineaceae bacterium]
MLAYVIFIEPYWVEVEQMDLTLPHLDPAFEELKIVQISDLHAGPTFNHDYYTQVIKTINELQPDLVVLTGDFVYHDGDKYAPLVLPVLNELAPKSASLAVLGNHDYWENAPLVRSVLQNAGIIELPNQVYTLQRGTASLHIVGLDDGWEHHNDIDLALQSLPAEGAAILLIHEPDFADDYSKLSRFDLQISGHSHGGQVILPLGSPFLVPRYATKFRMGLYQVRNMLLYVNRGIGAANPPARLNCRPEITLFTLHAPSNP